MLAESTSLMPPMGMEHSAIWFQRLFGFHNLAVYLDHLAKVLATFRAFAVQPCQVAKGGAISTETDVSTGYQHTVGRVCHANDTHFDLGG